MTYVQLIHDVFHHFSDVSCLKANLSKSQVYLGGMKQDEKQEILSKLGYIEGQLPVKYLGVPLSTRKLTISQCQALIEKITLRMRNRMSKLLFYAGRLQLIKSFMSGIQSYWSQIFCIPQKVTKVIESLCRSFL